MSSFALKTLLSHRGKLCTGIAGVVFSLVLMNVQGGLYLGLMRKASLLVDHCDADFWVCHRRIENVDLARDIPEVWMNRVRGLPGIDRVEPYIVGKGTATRPDGGMEDVWIVGSNPRTMTGSAWRFASGSARDLRRPGGVSFDTVDSRKLGYPEVGDWVEINGHHARLVAKTDGITGFITMPYLFTTLETARRLSNTQPGYCSFFLVKARRGRELSRLIAEVRRRVPDAVVYTPGEFAAVSQDYWMNRTGIGISFGASTFLGLLVGLLMVGQSLYAVAVDHVGDFATLKALGADVRQLFGMVLVQSMTIAAAGSAAGLAVVLTIRRFWSSPLAPVDIRPPLLGLSILVVLGICLAASLLPYIRLRRIDPAIVMQG
jgi:putative ABC transport system permease protein